MSTRNDQRLQRAVAPRLEPTEEVVTWSRAWVSRWGRLNFLLAARTRDFAVVTDRRLMLWSTGFFTRRPRRRVLTERLDELTFDSVGRKPRHRLLCTKAGHRPLLLEVGDGERARAVATALLGDGAEDTATVEAPTDEVTSGDAPDEVTSADAPDAGAATGEADPATPGPGGTGTAETSRPPADR